MDKKEKRLLSRKFLLTSFWIIELGTLQFLEKLETKWFIIGSLVGLLSYLFINGTIEIKNKDFKIGNFSISSNKEDSKNIND